MKRQFFFQLPDKICIVQDDGEQKGSVVSFKNSFCTVKRYLLFPTVPAEELELSSSAVWEDDPLFHRPLKTPPLMHRQTLNNDPLHRQEEWMGVVRLTLLHKRTNCYESISAVPQGRRFVNPFKRVQVVEAVFPGTVLTPEQLALVINPPRPYERRPEPGDWDYPARDPRMD